MTDKHISEEDVQLSLLDDSLLPAGAKEHLAQCAVCQARVREYGMLFSAIEAMPKSSFDFDVVELVMPVLPVKRKTSYRAPLVIAAILLAACLLVLPFWLLDCQVGGLWKTVSPWMISMAGIIALALTGISLSDMFNRYRQQMRQLNFE